MKSLLTGFLFFITALSVNAQEKDRYFSFELAGSGGLGSVNFEKIALDRERVDLYMRYGLSFVPLDVNNGFGLVFPIMVHARIGNNNHYGDFGIGQAFTVTTKGAFYLRMPTSFGYRFEPEGKRYYIRPAYTPIVSFLFDFQWEHWGGFTFGYRLGK